MDFTSSSAQPQQCEISKQFKVPASPEGASAVSEQENSVLPPSVPTVELESIDAERSCSQELSAAKLQSGAQCGEAAVRSSVRRSCSQELSAAKLPACETAEPPKRTHVLLLSLVFCLVDPYSTSQCTVYCRSVDSLESRNKEIEQFMSDAKSDGNVKNLLIIEMLDATLDYKQPVIGGKIVSDCELYKLLCCRKYSKPMKLDMVHILHRTGATEMCSATAERFEDDEQPPNCASLCNSESYIFHVKDSGVSCQEVQQALNLVESNGMEVTGENLARQLVSCCNGVQYCQMLGAPSASPDATMPPPKIPEIPVVECNALNRLQQQPSVECSEPSRQENSLPNLLISVCIGSYERDRTGSVDRAGFKNDAKTSTETAKLLGCRRENIFILCPEDGYVTADAMRAFISKSIEECKNKSISPRSVFFIVSTHGSGAGIHTSDGTRVPVGELVQQLEILGGFIMMFYQACRGSRFHACQAGVSFRPPYATGFGFVNPEIEGCVLPWQVPKAAAIFASNPGFKAYRNETDGSWMLRALLDVVRPPGTFTVRQLAQMVQARLHELKPDGIICSKTTTAYIQIQLSANAGSENFAFETGLASGAEAAADDYNDEAGHSAASEELAQLQLNEPSQPE